MAISKKTGIVVHIEDIIYQSKELNISKEDVLEALDYLKKRGDIFEPNPGFVQMI